MMLDNLVLVHAMTTYAHHKIQLTQTKEENFKNKEIKIKIWADDPFNCNI